MYLSVYLCLLFAICNVILPVRCTGRGYVVIGYPPDNNQSLPDPFSVTENAGTGQFPVYLLLLNETTGDPTGQYDNPVSVSCELTPVVNGYSRVTFVTRTGINPGTNQDPFPVNITFSIREAGRVASAYCWGVSEGSPTDPEFQKQTSISPSVNFEVRKAGTVNFCSDIIKVPYERSSTFTLELSEAVEEHEINVTCNVTSTAANPFQLNITEFTVPVGKKTLQVNYGILSQGSPVSVQCFAQSQNGGTQFLSGNSAGTPALFVLDTAMVMLYPRVTPLYTKRMQAFLVLDSVPDVKDLTFTCRVTVANSSEQAVYIAENPICEIDIPPKPPAPNSTEANVTTVTAPSSTDLSTDLLSTSASQESTTLSQTTSAGVITTTSSDNVTLSTAGATTEITNQPTVPQPGPGSTYNVTGEWTLTETTITFHQSTSDIYKSLEIKRTGLPSVPITELVVVTCCAPIAENNSPKYNQSKAAMLVVAQLQQERPINWTRASTPEDSNKESEIRNPGYVEVSPCPCDLSTACDTDCCCDSDCSSGTIETFTCIPGRFGGNPPENPHRNCTSSHFNQPDWFPFMCVQFERSAYLGLFWFPRSGLRQSSTYEQEISGSRPPYSYRETQTRIGEKDESLGYKHGTSVKTRIPPREHSFPLTLPLRTLTGECINHGPVRYLTNSDETCIRTHLKELCTAGSPLSVRHYVESSRVTHPPCPKASVVSKDNTNTPVDYTDVNYHCTTEFNNYIRSTKLRSEILQPNKKSLFNAELAENGTDCVFNAQSGAYECSVTSENITEVAPPSRCFWDDGYTRAPVPEYDNTTDTCTNVVLDVLYNFTWEGTSIKLLNATIILGNLSLSQEKVTNRTVTYSEPVHNSTECTNGSYTDGECVITTVNTTTQNIPSVLTQYFKVNYNHASNISNENITDGTTSVRYPRSGYLGYDLDKPVFSGVQMNQSRENETDYLYIDYNSTNRLSLWTPGSDGLCESAGLTGVIFGQNSISSCILRLGLQDINNCQYLRRLVLNRQDVLMSSSFISKTGDPGQDKLEDWINIVRDDMSGIFPNETIMINTTTASPVETTTEVSSTTEWDTTPNATIVNLRDAITGFCTNVTSGIHVDIMYTEAGLSNGLPRYEIVGAHIRYSQSTWRMDCGGAQAGRCYNPSDSQPLVQTFTITSSVTFIQVPPVPPAPKTRHELQYDTSVCEQDACWEELLYPLLRSYRGDDYSYILPFSFITIIFVIGLFFISRPWG